MRFLLAALLVAASASAATTQANAAKYQALEASSTKAIVGS